MIYYAGIGSRETPLEIQEYFTILGKYFAKLGFTLRSGGADGADKSFEIGCDKVKGRKEIYLPWNNFNGSGSDLIVYNSKAFETAQRFHPYWHNLKDGAKKLQARNSHQVLGWDLETPSSFIICYTKNGKLVGGTAQALRIAKHYNIPVFNTGNYDNLNDIKRNLKEFLITSKIIKEE